MSPRPYEPPPVEPASSGAEQKTDLASLRNPPEVQTDAAPAPLEGRAAPPPKTDFQSLGSSAMRYAPPPPKRSVTDLLIDAVTPTLIFFMVYSAVFFLLDVRFVFTEVHDTNIRFVALFFIVGVVALNRLIARDGSEEGLLYFILLAGAIGLYTLATTSMYGVGSIARGFMNDNPWLAAGFNMLVVTLLWWAVNRLTHECCVDENPQAGEVGILTGTVRQFQMAFAPRDVQERAAREKRDKPNWRRYFKNEPADVIVPMYELEPYDPTEPTPAKAKPKPEEIEAGKLSDKLRGRHPGMAVFYFSVPVILIFAFGLPFIRQFGPRWVIAGTVYMGIYTTSALLLLNLSSLAALREFFRARRVRMPGRVGIFWVGLGVTLVLMMLLIALQLPKPDLPPIAFVAERELDPWSRGEDPLAIVDPARFSEEQIARAQNMTQRAGRAALIVLGAFVGYGALRGLGSTAAHLGRNRSRLPRWLRRFFQMLDAFLQRVLRIPTLPRWRRPRRISRHVATSVKFNNSMGDERLSNQFTDTQHVEYAYEALCALAYDLGVPREAGQTPYEFIAHFPRELKALRTESEDLVQLYVQAAYSPIQLDARVQDRLRRFWITYNRVRRMHVR